MDSRPLLSALEDLIGVSLDAVTFTHDDWQLGFDGSILTVRSGMIVAVAGRRVRNGEETFRDCLCERIACSITGVSIGEDQLLLAFEDGSSLSIDMIPSTGPHALAFQLKGHADVWIA